MYNVLVCVFSFAIPDKIHKINGVQVQCTSFISPGVSVMLTIHSVIKISRDTVALWDFIIEHR